MHEAANNISPGINNQTDLESQPSKLTEEDFQKYSAQQVVQMQKQQLKNQDQHLDEIKVITGQIRYEAQNFNEEATDQVRMLDTLNKNMEKTEQKLDKANHRLDKFIRNSNQYCLWCIIITEIVVLVLLFVL